MKEKTVDDVFVGRIIVTLFMAYLQG
jgi:hypothetical protein